MTTENEQTQKKSPAEKAATASEPRIAVAPDSTDADSEPRPTLPDLDPHTAKFEADGYAHDTIPAPPLDLEEDEDEPDTQQG